MGRFVIREVPSGVKFDLRAANGEVVASSEVYTSAALCRRGIASVCKNAATQKVEDQTLPNCKQLTNPKYELYEDKKGQFRFRLRARNGQIIATSEPYTTKAACENGIESVRSNAADRKTE